jgi:hypothetical protein
MLPISPAIATFPCGHWEASSTIEEGCDDESILSIHTSHAFGRPDSATQSRLRTDHTLRRRIIIGACVGSFLFIALLGFGIGLLAAWSQMCDQFTKVLCLRAICLKCIWLILCNRSSCSKLYQGCQSSNFIQPYILLLPPTTRPIVFFFWYTSHQMPIPFRGIHLGSVKNGCWVILPSDVE